MLAEPTALPSTTHAPSIPPDTSTDAIAGSLLLHVPEPVVLLNPVVSPIQTLRLPVIVFGNGFIVALVVLMSVQPFASSTDTVYVPLAAVGTEDMEGFCKVEVNEFGPLHE